MQSQPVVDLASYACGVHGLSPGLGEGSARYIAMPAASVTRRCVQHAVSGVRVKSVEILLVPSNDSINKRDDRRGA